MNDDNCTPWRPGYLLDRVTNEHQTQRYGRRRVMAVIGRAKAKGMDTENLERVEAIISITDDAIRHAMRKG